MAKEVQMSIKMEPELRDQFMAVAANRHRPGCLFGSQQIFHAQGHLSHGQHVLDVLE